MKNLNNKFIIFVFIIVLFSGFTIFSKYKLYVFERKNIPLNIFDYALFNFKKDYPYPKIKTIGFYTDAIGDRRIHTLYELQDSIMPIFIKDSPDNDYVLCAADINVCEKFAQNYNLEIKDKYGNIILYARKGIK